MGLKQHFSESRLMKPLATLLSGNVMAQGITMLSYLLLTRIYTPDDFGLFGIFYSYIEVLIILSTCKYELAPVIAESDREATAIMRFTMRLNAVVSVLLLTVLLVLNLCHALPGKVGQIGYVSLLIPPLVFFCGTTRVYAAMFNRFHQFKQIAFSDLTISASGALAKIVLGLVRFLHFVGLPLGTVLGQAAGNINYLISLKRLNLPKDISRQEMWAAVRKHRKFPLYTAPKDFIDAFSGNLPFLWLPLAMAVGDAELGLLLLALTFTLRPVNVFNTAVERVLYVDIKERMESHQRIGGRVGKFMLLSNLAIVPFLVVAYLYAEPIFVFVFGAKWIGTGPYIQALLPWVWVLFSANSLYCIPYAFGRQRVELYFCLALLALRVALLWVGIVRGDFMLAVQLYALSGLVIGVARLCWYIYLLRRYDSSLA